MSGLVAATIIAGVLLIVMGVMRLGTLIRFVPHTITTGFTAGIAVTIVIGQLKDFMGLTYPAGTAPIESMDKLACVVQNLGTLNVRVLAVGLACLAVLVLWPRVTERVPASLVAVLAGIALVSGLNLSVNTIGDLYSIQGGAPRLSARITVRTWSWWRRAPATSPPPRSAASPRPPSSPAPPFWWTRSSEDGAARVCRYNGKVQPLRKRTGIKPHGISC